MKNFDFAAAFDASPNPYVVMTPTFVILHANAAYLRVTGRTLASIVDRSMFDAFPSTADGGMDDSGMLLRESLERTVRSAKPDLLPLIRYGIATDTPQGKVFAYRYWSATHTPLLGEDGRVLYVLQHTEDVTELQTLRRQQRVSDDLSQTDFEQTQQQRLLQRAGAVQEQNRLLHMEADLMRSLFAQAPGFMAFFRGPRHVFEMANAAYEALVERSGLVGSTLHEALPELQGQGMFELMNEVYATGKARLLAGRAVWLRLHDHQALEERFIDAVLQPVIEADGSVSGIFLQGHDITEQKRAQDELQRHRDQLEHLVDERTRALRRSEEERLAMQAALHQSQKMEAIGKLTGGVAHDFNNVLQVIAGNLQLLRQASLEDARTQRRVDSAMRGVERGAKLASHLLAFARKQPLVPVVLNVGKLVRNLDDMLRRALGETVELETVVGGGTWNTLADPNFLENALLNLAINARDAMEGRGKLTIEAGNASLDDAYAKLHSEVTPGQYVLIAVSDTGSGMDESILQQVFEPFFTTKAEGHGTGLGLSMVYGFVKQSGGHVKIYSEVGHGTTVKLYLPRSHELEIAEELPTLDLVTGGSETILVVEDDAQVRETVVELLSELGYRVLKAPDAQSALTVVESGVPIDLIFTDVVMPGPMRSPELARRAQALQPHIEVLFTSGYTENSIVHGGRLDPGVALLSKPYRRDDLARKVRHMLSNRRHVVRLEEQVSHLTAESMAADSDSRNMVSLRLLVVEDNAEALAAVLELLEHLGHRPQGATSAEAALQALAQGTFDVLMTDVNLPGTSGTTLAHEALALQPLQVVYATGMSQVSDGVPGALFLQKPFGLAEMDAVLTGSALVAKPVV